MSEVLTLKAGGKRPFDAMEVSTAHPHAAAPFQCSPHRAPFFPAATAAASAKRARASAAAAPAVQASFPAPGVVEAVPVELAARRAGRPRTNVAGKVGRRRGVGMRAAPGETSSSSSDEEQADARMGESADAAVSLEAVGRHLSKKLRRRLASSDHVEAADQGRLPIELRRVFCLDDVREVAGAVVAEREASLKAEFAKHLQEQLAEQFNTFTKFNEDYINAQLRQRDCPYLS